MNQGSGIGWWFRRYMLKDPGEVGGAVEVLKHLGSGGGWLRGRCKIEGS